MTHHAEPTRARRWLAVAVVGGVLAGGGGTGCHRHGPAAGGATTSKAQDARRQVETCAVDAVKAAAAAQVAAHPEARKRNAIEVALGKLHLTDKPTAVGATTAPAPPPPEPPKPSTPPPAVANRVEPPLRSTSPVVIRERVVSAIPYPTAAEAEERVFQDAQDRIEQKLRELDPPVVYRPALADVVTEYVRKSSRVERAPTDREKELIKEIGYGADRVYVEYTVEVTAEQVRALRTEDRLAAGLRALGAVTAAALAGFLFLRLDEWTKGYLTSWLALAAAALAGGAAAALVFV